MTESLISPSDPSAPSPNSSAPPIIDRLSAPRELPAWLRTLLALLGTLVAMALMVLLLGANPLLVARAIYTGSIGNPIRFDSGGPVEKPTM